MKCLDDSLLQMFVEGALDAHEEEIVRLHLSLCRACRGRVAAYKQLMWDLEHPAGPELPPELDRQRAVLMSAWNAAQRGEHERPRRAPRSLIPAWAGYTVLWARYIPPVERVGGFLARTGNRLLASRLPLYRRLQGRGGDRR